MFMGYLLSCPSCQFDKLAEEAHQVREERLEVVKGWRLEGKEGERDWGHSVKGR